MYKKLFLITYCLISIFVYPQQIDISKIDNYLEEARKEWESPGMAVCIVMNDSVILSKGYGTISAGSKVKVNADTKFGIASLTKAFTSAAIAILVDEKKLKWDDKVIDYVPYFSLYDDYVTQNTTIRDILSHRTGLATFSGDLIWYASKYNSQEIIEHARYLKPVHGFREKYGYSNIMYLVAGEIIKAVSGKTWEEFIKEKIFDKLGMKDSNTSITLQKNEKNVAQPHAKVDGLMVPISYVNWDNIAPAGAINSTVNDMAKWIIFQLNKGKWKDEQIISEKQMREMHLPQTIDNVSLFSEALMPSKHFNSYCLGWESFDFYGYKIVAHSGGLDGMVCQLFLIPEIKTGGVILTNSATTLPYACMYQLIEYFIGNPQQNDWSKTYLNYYKNYEEYMKEKEAEAMRMRNKDKMPTLSIQDYAGLYSGNVYGACIIEYKNNQLHLKLAHTPTMYGALEHWEGDVFRIKLKEHPSLPYGTVTFFLDENKQRVMSLQINIPNPDFDFTELDFNKIK
jgi:CubicO group peptidase (beta-lactamase class C family)